MTIRRHEPRVSPQAAIGRFGSSFADALARQQADRDADVVEWAETHFYIERDRPIRLLPHQVALVRLFAERPADGRLFKTQIFSTVKKSGKTAVAALLTRYDAETGPGAREIYLAANDKDQAKNRVFEAIRRSIIWDESASAEWTVTSHELRHANGTFIRALASDFRGEAGSNPSRTVWTELWGFEHENNRRFFEELTPVPTVESVRFIETSTGYEGQSDLLFDLYVTAKAGRQLTAGELAALTRTPLGVFVEAPAEDDLVPIWINDHASLLAYWDEGLVARRMPWQQGADGTEYYQEQEQLLRPSQFKRLHLNQWSQSEEAFIDISWWDRCEANVPELVGQKERLVVALDAGLRNDGFALVGVTRHWDPARRHDSVAVRVWNLWTPPRGGQVNFEDVRAEILALAQEHSLAMIVYDEYQLAYFAQQLRGSTGGFIRSFDQGQDREVADKRLFDLIQAGRIAHCNPREIREHLLNANARVTDRERMRIVKRTDAGKIDLAVALSMAAHECLRLNL